MNDEIRAAAEDADAARELERFPVYAGTAPMRPYVVYLAGGYDSGWRAELRDRWADRPVVLFDPFVDSRQGAVYEFTNDDLLAIRAASLVFAYVDYERYTGTALEVGFAHGLRIPVIYATVLPRVDSMMAALARAVFTSLDEAAAYAERSYLPRPRPRVADDVGGAGEAPDE